MQQAVLFASIILLLLSSASAQPEQGRLLQRFQQLDKNSDGKLTPAELTRPLLFRRLDADSDGVVTLDEVQKRGAALVAGVAAKSAMAVKRDVAYGKHKDQRLDVYSPKKGVKDSPVMVYVHGGAWMRGNKSSVGKKATFFTGRGWILVSVNYRLVPDGQHPRNVEDVATALAWVHDHCAEQGGDPNLIFLMGHSAGCHLAALVATDGRPLKKAGKSLTIVKGVIGLDTQTYDIPQLMKSASSSAVYAKVFTEDESTQRDASPIHHVQKNKGIPPFLICYSRGMATRLNPARPEQAKAFCAALNSAGVEAEVVDASDRNHGQINQRFGDPKDNKVTGKATEFLKAILGKEDAR